MCRAGIRLLERNSLGPAERGVGVGVDQVALECWGGLSWCDPELWLLSWTLVGDRSRGLEDFSRG